jgi:hypothetical protein
MRNNRWCGHIAFHGREAWTGLVRKGDEKAMKSCPIFFDGCKTSLLQAAPRHAHET